MISPDHLFRTGKWRSHQLRALVIKVVKFLLQNPTQRKNKKLYKLQATGFQLFH